MQGVPAYRPKEISSNKQSYPEECCHLPSCIQYCGGNEKEAVELILLHGYIPPKQ
jgi:hypothetical protein